MSVDTPVNGPSVVGSGVVATPFAVPQDLVRALARGVMTSGLLAGDDLIDSRPPERVDRYEVVRPLTRGGGVQTLLGRDPVLDREVLITLAERASQGAAARLRREMRGLARLRHPGLVQIFDAGILQGRPYVVSEWIDQPTLRDRWPAREECLDVLEGVARAVHAAHQAGALHLGLEPGCVLVGPRPVVTGLGQSAAAGGERGAQPAPEYAAPEQLENKAVSRATDVWALGVMLHEALTGAPPFDGDDARAVLRRIDAGPPVPPRALDPTISPAVQAVVLRALERDPRRRFQTAQDLAQALRVARRAPAAEPARAAAPPASSHAAIAAWLALGLVLAVTLVVGVNALVAPAPPPPPPPTVAPPPPAARPDEGGASATPRRGPGAVKGAFTPEPEETPAPVEPAPARPARRDGLDGRDREPWEEPRRGPDDRRSWPGPDGQRQPGGQRPPNGPRPGGPRPGEGEPRWPQDGEPRWPQDGEPRWPQDGWGQPGQGGQGGQGRPPRRGPPPQGGQRPPDDGRGPPPEGSGAERAPGGSSASVSPALVLVPPGRGPTKGPGPGAKAMGFGAERAPGGSSASVSPALVLVPPGRGPTKGPGPGAKAMGFGAGWAPGGSSASVTLALVLVPPCRGPTKGPGPEAKAMGGR